MRTLDALLVQAGERALILVGSNRDGWFLYPAERIPAAGPFPGRSDAIAWARETYDVVVEFPDRQDR
jgi:hypothetical protein